MNNPDWHKKNYRRNLVDMHIEAWDPDFLTQFDPKAYVDCMIAANVSCCMVYANSHAGFAYWPAPGGNQHPNLKGRDIFGEVVDLCHRNNIEVITYYTLIYDNWAYNQDPAWRIIQADGYSAREQTELFSGRYGLACPNAEGYREFTRKQVTDLVTKYEFESIFFDMTFWPSVCYCPSCKARFEKEIGGVMPRIINWNDPTWNAFQDAREKWLNEFAFFATNTVKALKPKVTVNHQYSLITQSWVRGVTEDHTDPCDYVGGDFYAGPTEQGLICKLFNSLSGSFEFHTSRCLGLGDHTTVKTMEHLKLQSCIALAHNGAFLFIDAIDPVGTLNKEFYQKMGTILREFQEYEPYLGGSMIADVAILFDMWSKFDFHDNGKNALDPSAQGMPHLDAVVGAARALKEKHIPYTVIGRRNLKNGIDKYRVIIMPDILRLSDEAAEDIRAYVRAGGTVYASGHSGITNLGDVFGFEPIGETAQEFTYLAPSAGGKSFFADSSPKYPLALNTLQQIVKAKPGAAVLATTVLPYTDRTDSGNFSSIHSNPPGVPTDNPGMIGTAFGKGRVIWAAGPIEGYKENFQDKVFISCIDNLLDKKYSVIFEAPPATEAICFAQDDGIIVSILNTQTTLPPVTVHDLHFTIDLKGRSCAQVLLLPKRSEIKFTETDGAVRFDLPPLELFHMVKVVYK
ncbi:alpha-amylase family protein [Treponema primitia]|uniref:alpha-amylase family protein n=1 Tax=Treponema primitia TaxID=88058 RepID=UPI0002554EB3|nr:alpha-amylase family protein [Treponema primitia]